MIARVFILDTPRARAEAAHALANAVDGSVITIGDAPSTVAQRRAFWAIMQDIAEHLAIVSVVGDELTRHDAETWAEYFLGRYAPRREIQLAGGEARWIRESINRIDAPSFGRMLGQIEAEAASMGMEFHETRGTLDQWQAIGRRIALTLKEAAI